MIVYLLLFLLSFSLPQQSHATCPNQCNQNGICELGQCQCFPSFHGIDCSVRVCPSGSGWFDEPSADNTAHGNFRECSNMGKCNRQTGECECRKGFTGPACNTMACPQGTASNGKLTPCSGHGRCTTLRTAAATTDYFNLFNGSSYTDWDADMIQGCVCDSGWHGVNCSLRTCPHGDNPTSAGVDEVQLIDCTCSDYHCDGSFKLLVRGQQTESLPINATEEILVGSLLKLFPVDAVRVNIVGERFCTREGSTTSIKFVLPQDTYNVMKFEITSATLAIFTGGDASVLHPTMVSVAGTREYVECSDHGTCDYTTGSCQCFDGFGSSDGFGNLGKRGDCGYHYAATTSHVINGVTVISGCPYEYNGINSTKLFCSGRGTCNHVTGTCTCYSGFEGAGCKKRTCGSGIAWFGNVQSGHTSRATCSGIGDCNYITGKCETCGGWGLFTGDTCSQMACASSGGLECSGNGVCLTLKEIAQLTYGTNKTLLGVTYSTPWDADVIRGCSCFRSWTVDDQYSQSYFPSGNLPHSSANNYNRTKFYRGPYAFAVSDWTGYDCSLATCPTGLDPSLTSSRIGLNEIQLFHCKADHGTLKLQFRGNTTRPIPYSSTAAQLESYLEELYTIGDVKVSNPVDSGICDDAYITIEFLTEFGNLPLIVANSTFLSYSSLSVTTVQDGTKIEAECSAMGICDQSTGRCKCMQGYTSSDGTLTNTGERGDCSYYNNYYTTQGNR